MDRGRGVARVRWGVLSTASIGRLVIEATRAADHAEFVAVASRDADRARAFADELGLEASYITRVLVRYGDDGRSRPEG